MPLVLSFVIGLFVTIVLMPLLIRASPRLGLLDVPDDRKIHSGKIPRVGGIAIAVGIALPLFIWFPIDRLLASCLAGGAVVLAAGIWDDRRPLAYQWKLVAQSVAVALVMAGGVRFEHLPFFGLDPAPIWLAYAVTFVFILGIINALNLFDGLDGLAGGCALLSLGAIAFLDFEVGGSFVALVALAAMGGILGFLRYNNHPAIVFMGDAGSQLLGFTASVLVILLVEKTHSALNPALPLLLLGLPVYDTVSVLVLRLRKGQSPFKPDQNHLHHKLLRVGFRHYEAVGLIYAVQALMVGCGLALSYSSDFAVVSTFVVITCALMLTLYCVRISGWQAHAADRADGSQFQERRTLWLRRWKSFPSVVTSCTAYGFVGFLVITAFLSQSPSLEMAWISLSVSCLLALSLLIIFEDNGFFIRLGLYVCGIIFILHLFGDQNDPEYISVIINAYILIMLSFALLGIRVTRRTVFQLTPQDLLVAFFVLALPILPIERLTDQPIGPAVLRAVALFYVIEFLLSRPDGHHRVLLMSSMVSLAVFAVRGLI